MTTLPAWLQAVYIALLVTCSLAGWGFVIRYMAIYKWWKTEYGRHLITFTACLSALFSFYLLALVWPGMPGRTAIRTALFFLLTAAMVWRVVMFERIRWQARRESKGTK
jgi:hypothetical protein